MFRVYAGMNSAGQVIRFILSCRLPDKDDWLTNETYEDERLSKVVGLKAICKANDIDAPPNRQYLSCCLMRISFFLNSTWSVLTVLLKPTFRAF